MPTNLITDRAADDVVATATGHYLWVAWGRAELGTETVRWSSWDGTSWTEPHPLANGCTAFRPVLAQLGDQALLVASARDRVVGALLSHDHQRTPFELAAAGAVHTVAAADGADDAWLAWDERRGATADIRLGRVDAMGQFHEQQLPPAPNRWRHTPVLASGHGAVWAAWIEGAPRGPGQLTVARVTAAGLEAPAVMQNDPAPHAGPTLLATAEGCLAAWHGPAGTHTDADVLRWLRVAAIDGRDGTIAPMHPTPPVLERADAGPDQGWEFPAIALHQDAIWIAGRSSHGYHVAARSDAGWSRPSSLSDDFWGGRGRRHSLVHYQGELCLARREPDGIAVTRIPATAAQEPAPVIAASPAPARRSRPAAHSNILFGDLHQHTALSDGCGTPEELYLGARDLRQLDFAAVTDHDRFCRRTIGPATWHTICDIADAYNEPGRFTTFRAYEFTGARMPGPGHKCVYFGDSVPDQIPEKEVDALFAVLREHGGIAVPHHLAWTGTGADHHDPELQPVWEIMSVHGCYECCDAPTQFPPRADVILPGEFVCDALAAGLKFGFIGSTDSHGLLWHHGVGKKRNPFEQGVAAVVGAQRDRQSIFAALRARRCYATTGARIELQLDLDGAAIGADLPAGTRGALRVEVQGTAPLQRVDLVTSTGEHSLSGIDGAKFTATVELAPRPDKPTDYAYVRVTQQDGEAAWSSPYWLG